MVVLWVSDRASYSTAEQALTKSEPTLTLGVVKTSDVDGHLFSEKCTPQQALEGCSTSAARGVRDHESIPRAPGHTSIFINHEPTSPTPRAPSPNQARPPPGDGDSF